MAHCVISLVFDTEVGRMVPACVVHTSHAPCLRNGEPASTTPLETWDDHGRTAAVKFWRTRTHGQRPLIVHHGRPDDEREHGGADCWCGPERIEARS
jgi:hypothetical protein